MGGPAVAVLLLGYGLNYVAFWVFIGAICTDLVDGWIARRLDAFTDIGKWLDPLADKVLTNTVWISLWAVDFAPAWLALGSVVRDLVVIAGWSYVARRGKRFSVNAIGQVGVAFEGVALSVLLFHGPWLDVHWPSVGTILGFMSLALSLASVAGYVITGPRGPDP